jgi:hypothetical protein
MRLEKHKKLLNLQRKKDREHSKLRQHLRMKSRQLKPRPPLPKKKPKKLLQRQRKHKRRQLIGRKWLRRPRKRQHKRWLMLRQPKKNVKKN